MESLACGPKMTVKEAMANAKQGKDAGLLGAFPMASIVLSEEVRRLMGLLKVVALPRRGTWEADATAQKLSEHILSIIPIDVFRDEDFCQ